jgi:uncharacterized protein YprB with RNaseH-like and TPR domain
MSNKQLRCIHRHTIQNHPKCFARGLVKYVDEKSFIKETGEPWYKYPGYRIGYLDIETDGFDADFSSMLTWCIKAKGGGVASDHIVRSEVLNPNFEVRILKSLINEMSNYNILVTYYGTGFDLVYARTKALHYGLNFPGYGDIYHFDLYYTAKSKLKLSRYSLANVTDYLGIKGKTPVDKEVWRRARYADEDAIKIVLEHNYYDVWILEQLHEMLEPTRKWIRKSI